MRYPASEKLEIIRQVEQSHLSAKQTLDLLGIPGMNRPGFTGDLLLHFTRPYRARRAVHRSSLLPRLAGYFRWGQAGAGC